MSNVESILFPFIGGLGLFLFGMHVMAEGLQKAAGNKMRRALEKVTNNRLIGVLVGFLVTGVIQSSSATTVMIVGFVNAGIMNVGQTVGLIMGANIGTTVTAWIVSSVEWARFLKPTTIAPLAVGVGACMAMFAPQDRLRRIGEIVVGFGVLFLGMDIMTRSVSPLKDSEVFRNVFTSLGTNPFLGILAGAAITGVIQSSSASVGILQSLASLGLVPWGAAVYIIMGQNIGTCVTAILSSIGASKNAKSAAYIHLMFNVIGSVVFGAAAIIIFKVLGDEATLRPILMTQISMVHTSFNIAGTVLMYPFADWLVKIGIRMAGVKDDRHAASFIHLDDRMILGNPSIAIQSCLMEIRRMGRMAIEALSLSCEAVVDKNGDKARQVIANEENIDLMQQGITRFLAKICGASSTSQRDNEIATSLFHTVNDIERIGDHSVNLAEIAEMMITGGIGFTQKALDEVIEMIAISSGCFTHSIEALTTNDRNLAGRVFDEEEETDSLQKTMRENHMLRLSNDECNPYAGVAFLDVMTNLERVSDHAKNIAQTVLKIAK